MKPKVTVEIDAQHHAVTLHMEGRTITDEMKRAGPGYMKGTEKGTWHDTIKRALPDYNEEAVEEIAEALETLQSGCFDVSNMLDRF